MRTKRQGNSEGRNRTADAEILKIGVDIAQGAAATMEVDVFGYLF